MDKKFIFPLIVKSTVLTKETVFEIIIKNIYINLYRVCHGFRQNEAR